MAIPDLQLYPWNHNLKNVEDTVVFLALEVLNSDVVLLFDTAIMFPRKGG